MSNSIEFDVLYFKPDNNGRGPGRVFSHKYRERWQRIQMYCPNCGKQAVWQEDSAGDYYVGERYLCLACEHNWTIQGPYSPHPSDEQGSQRIEKIRPSNRKFELVPDQSIECFGRTLFRIRALISFAGVTAGDLGGYVEKETNVDHDGNAWVFGNAWVYGNALVSGNAQVAGDARVSGNARVSGDAWVSGNAQVSGNANLCWISNVGSESGTLTAFTAQAGITVTRGCFLGTLEEFEAAVKETHGDSRIAAEYSLLIQFIRMRLGDAQARLAQHDPSHAPRNDT